MTKATKQGLHKRPSKSDDSSEKPKKSTKKDDLETTDQTNAKSGEKVLPKSKSKKTAAKRIVDKDDDTEIFDENSVRTDIDNDDITADGWDGAFEPEILDAASIPDKLIEERILNDEELLDRVIKRKQEQLDALLKAKLQQRENEKNKEQGSEADKGQSLNDLRGKNESCSNSNCIHQLRDKTITSPSNTTVFMPATTYFKGITREQCDFSLDKLSNCPAEGNPEQQLDPLEEIEISESQAQQEIGKSANKDTSEFINNLIAELRRKVRVDGGEATSSRADTSGCKQKT